MAQAQDPRVQSLLRRMSLEEKLSLVHGARDPRDLGQAGYWPGVPRLGIPPLRFADGPPGINVNRESTGMPAPLALAATFDVRQARLYGVVMGRDAAALEQNVVLAPHVNIVRDPLFRRNHTAFSEDPLLSAAIGAAEIQGIQSQGVMAQVKHLAGYNGAQDVTIDERTLHDIYLPPFVAAIEAGAASVMCAYNRINGEWACGNGAMMNGALRTELGFKGFVTSDWGAVHSPAAITNGLDLEMPGRTIAGRPGGPWFIEPLKAEIEKGTIPIADVDRAVGRILGQMLRFGLLDQKPRAAGKIDVEADAKIVRGVAASGAVLLRNQNSALPLTRQDLASLVLIGPTAGQLAAGYLGERAYGFESRLVSPLAVLRHGAPQAKITYSPGVNLTGVPIPAAVLSHEGRPGLLRSREASDITATQLDTSLNFDRASALEANADFAWKGTLTIAEEGDYTLLVQPALDHGSEGGGSIAIDGKRAARTGGPGFGGTGMAPKKWSWILPTLDGRDNGGGASLHLTAGPHRIELTANSHGEGPLRIRFAWITPQARRTAIDAAVAAARGAHTAVVFAWCGTGTIDLPEAQDELIARVSESARKTIVVLNTGGPVRMPWKDTAGAILEMWYPGQEGGWATADVLLGRVNPAGRLPVTFPHRLEDTAPYSPGHAERIASKANYSEGLAVGYRWLDQEGIEPLFAFGHGLSYTRFEYADLVLNGTGKATFVVRNAGPVRGSEVVQLYLGPGRNLAAFQRIELAAGESRTVTLAIPPRAMSNWSVERHAWVHPSAARTVYIGASSRDIRLTAMPKPD